MPTSPVIVTSWLEPSQQTDFVVGDSVRWHVSFADPTLRTPVDPDIVIFDVTNPSPLASTPNVYGASSVVRDSAGNYHLDVPLTVVGKWILNGIAQGNPNAVGIGSSEMRLTAYASGQ